MSTTTVFIPSTVYENGVTYYRLVVSDLNYSHINATGPPGTLRRYSDLVHLHQQLLIQFPLHQHLLSTIYFPPKSIRKNSTVVVATRQRDLAHYLTYLIQTSPFCSCRLLFDVLGIPPDTPLPGSIPPNRLGLGPSHNNTTNWFDRFHRVQSAIVQVRKSVLDKDNKLVQGDTLAVSTLVSTILADIDAILNEIKCLDQLLSPSITSCVPSSTNESLDNTTSTKERLRRSNLLLSVRQQVITIQQGLTDSNIHVTTDSHPTLTTNQLSTTNTSTSSNSIPKQPRVIGRTTNITSSLPFNGITTSEGKKMTINEVVSMDNKGLIQLQREQMQDQDKVVDQIGEVVGRLKNLGHVMNDELSTQNQVIDEFRVDMNRVQTKSRITNKRFKKLK